ncbi:HK97 family phage prohead protease [Magnetospirillum sp. 15-1]|uniref:HK97 family phage prohead protease n=1 Tax=Magnetospirillum sp. 15-1 TaxID=1979370 RepID=UPI000BBC5325|nr:HK97 family phage prohead protease [Magnetospirillum sp. 15-1]
MAATIERRGAFELRAAGGRRLEGYAATFNSPAQIGRFKEIIKPGAFRSSLLAGKDVLALVDHQPGQLLARTSAGTLRLSEDAKGLKFEIDVPATTLGNDILALAESRNLGGMSFGFRVTDEAWPKGDMRELRAVDLIEISVVQAFPAYSATEINARSAAAVGASLSRAQRYMETVR